MGRVIWMKNEPGVFSMSSLFLSEKMRCFITIRPPSVVNVLGIGVHWCHYLSIWNGEIWTFGVLEFVFRERRWLRGKLIVAVEGRWRCVYQFEKILIFENRLVVYAVRLILQKILETSLLGDRNFFNWPGSNENKFYFEK